jgi:hypothetical protein
VIIIHSEEHVTNPTLLETVDKIIALAYVMLQRRSRREAKIAQRVISRRQLQWYVACFSTSATHNSLAGNSTVRSCSEHKQRGVSCSYFANFEGIGWLAGLFKRCFSGSRHSIGRCWLGLRRVWLRRGFLIGWRERCWRRLLRGGEG